ncbi:PLP-dependent aminotransferase family protein [Paenibacillus sp. MCAF20]
MLIPPQWSDTSSEPIYVRIYRFYKENILTGSLSPNSRLPSIRALAQHLGISRNPVETAYAHLVAEGYIVNKAKSGYYSAVIEQLTTAENGKFTRSLPITPPVRLATPAVDIDFSHDKMSTEHFPLPLWKKMTLNILRSTDLNLFNYGDNKGEPKLRSLISEYLRQNRGVVCEPRQVIITSGTQQSVYILSSLLRNKEGAIGVEAAMHPGIYYMFKQLLNPVHLPLDRDGLSCSEATSSDSIPLKSIYVTPSHQFPYGMVLPAAKRIQLLNWAIHTDGYIIEDDYDNEFLYEGSPLPALQGMDNNGRVIYLGTFSKALAPAIRLSYLILPQTLLEHFDSEYVHYDQTASRLTQKTMELFMEQGHLGRHVRRMRKLYRDKRDQLIRAIHAAFGNHANVLGSASGLHLILAFHSTYSTEQLVQLAESQGIRVYPVSYYHVAGRNVFTAASETTTASQFVLGYGGLTAEQITLGVEKLAEVWLES